MKNNYKELLFDNETLEAKSNPYLTKLISKSTACVSAPSFTYSISRLTASCEISNVPLP